MRVQHSTYLVSGRSKLVDPIICFVHECRLVTSGFYRGDHTSFRFGDFRNACKIVQLQKINLKHKCFTLLLLCFTVLYSFVLNQTWKKNSIAYDTKLKTGMTMMVET